MKWCFVLSLYRYAIVQYEVFDYKMTPQYEKRAKSRWSYAYAQKVIDPMHTHA
jgi:hypothetical protein